MSAMGKKIKLTEAEAIEMMGFAKTDGHIDGWTISKTGFVRYFDAKARVWRDLLQMDFDRWKYAV